MRRLLKWSLRGMLVAILLLSLGMAWFVSERSAIRRQRALVARFPSEQIAYTLSKSRENYPGWLRHLLDDTLGGDIESLSFADLHDRSRQDSRNPRTMRTVGNRFILDQFLRRPHAAPGRSKQSTQAESCGDEDHEP
jgi:hypothetical protein